MVRDFVRNTPWRNQEEKSTIQAFHKIAWHLKCPSSKVDQFYMILKVMKNNKSIFRLLGVVLMLTHYPDPDALSVHQIHMVGLVHFHTSLQMSINHVALRGLINPDKEVVILHWRMRMVTPRMRSPSLSIRFFPSILWMAFLLDRTSSRPKTAAGVGTTPMDRGARATKGLPRPGWAVFWRISISTCSSRESRRRAHWCLSGQASHHRHCEMH